MRVYTVEVILHLLSNANHPKSTPKMSPPLNQKMSPPLPAFDNTEKTRDSRRLILRLKVPLALTQLLRMLKMLIPSFIVALRVILRRWAWLSPLLHHNEDFGLKLSGHLQCSNSSRPQGANKGSEPQYRFS